MLLINYATENYKAQQAALSAEAHNAGFQVIEFSPIDIPEDYYLKHKLILDQKRGAGSALWKPYIIEKTMMELRTGAKLLYMDCGDKIIRNDFRNYIETKLDSYPFFFVQNTHLNKHHTRRDCFTLMDCDDEYYWNYPILEAGICGFEVTNRTIAFVNEWLRWSEQEDVIMDVENKNLFGKGNLEGYTNHKCDQSVLTNLVAKGRYNTTPIQEVMHYVSYNYRG